MFDRVGASRARTYLKDRRHAHRYKLNWPARVIVKDSSSHSCVEGATLRDLSSTGALAQMKISPSVGLRIFFSVKLPFDKETWMSYSATVVRVTEETKGVAVALKFDTSRPEFADTKA
jgi:hypothetical protein